jgi:hypothetical protein
MHQQWMDEILAKAKTYSHVYMIEMRKNQNKWFFLDLDEKKVDLVQVLWTPQQRNAHVFLTEEMVEEFKSDHISPRKVSIIRMPSLEVFLRLG